jgi:hypothetical protein
VGDDEELQAGCGTGDKLQKIKKNLSFEGPGIQVNGYNQCIERFSTY